MDPSSADGARTGARSRDQQNVQPCAWCGRPVENPPSGRRRLYCRRSCRQRAYESRRSMEALGLPEGSVVLSEQEVSDLMDRIFAMRCACEDLDTALEEGAEPSELKTLAAQLMESAREAERLR